MGAWPVLWANDINILKDAPSEIKILIDSYSFTQDQLIKDNILTSLKQLEKDLGKLERKIEFLLIKNDIYKTLMEYPHSQTSANTIGPKSIKQFNRFLQKNEKKLSPLAKWICQALLQELKQEVAIPIDNPLFSSQMKARSRILKGWLSALRNKSVEEINAYFDQVLALIINNLTKRISLFLNYSQDFRRIQPVSLIKIVESQKPGEESHAPEVKNIEKKIEVPPTGKESKPEWEPRSD